MTKRPLLSVAAWYAAGLLLAEFCKPPLFWLFLASLLAVIGALAIRKASRSLLPLALLLTGWTNLTYRSVPISPFDVRRIQGDEAALVTVRGALVDTPAQRAPPETGKVRSLGFVDVSSLRAGKGEWSNAFGRVLVTTPGALAQSFRAGEQVEIVGVLAAPPGAFAEGLFDYRRYLANAGVYFQLRTQGADDWQLLSAGTRPIPFSERFLAWAQGKLALGLPEQDEALGLLWSMTLGWKTALGNEIFVPFMQSGTMHIFAISGLHIALIAGILVGVLRVARVPRGVSGLITLPLLWFYTGATGWQPSAIRSAIMMSVIIVGWALRRPSNLLNSLAAAAFIILLWDPRQLFGASFQLSFLVVLSLAVFSPIFRDWRERLLAPDPFLPVSLVPRWRRMLNVPMRWGLDSLGTSAAAWIGALPLTAYYFNLFSPVTLLANLVIVPLSSCALACNVGSLVLSFAPPVVSLLNHSAWFWMKCMVIGSQWASCVPRGYWYVRAPDAVDLFLYSAIVGLTLAEWLRFPRWQFWRWGILGVLTVVLVGKLALPRAYTELSVLPLNGCLGVYVDAQRVLVDTGDAGSVQFETIPFLHARGVNRLKSLVLTHGDIRHVGGSGEFAGTVPTDKVFASGVKQRSRAYRNALSRFADEGRLVQVSASERIAGQWTVLHPAEDYKSSRADDGALVLRGNIEGTTVLLMSDLSRAGQEALLAREPELHADILISGLPADRTALTDTFLDCVKPKLIIVGDSEFPAGERARPELIERLTGRCQRAVFCHESGVVTVRFRRGGAWEVRSMQAGEEKGNSKGQVSLSADTVLDDEPDRVSR